MKNSAESTRSLRPSAPLFLTSFLAALILIGSASAHAATLCVNIQPACAFNNFTAEHLQVALTAARGNPGADIVRVGPGTYTSASGFNSSDNDPLTVVGAGPGSTFLNASGNGSTTLTSVFAQGGDVSGMTLSMTDSPRKATFGLRLTNGTIHNVDIRDLATEPGKFTAAQLDLNSIVRNSSIEVGAGDTGITCVASVDCTVRDDKRRRARSSKSISGHD